MGDVKRLQDKVSTEILYGFLMMVLESDLHISLEDLDLSYIKDTQNIMACLIYCELKWLDKNNLLYDAPISSEPYLSQIVRGRIDVTRCTREATWFQDKVWSTHPDFTYKNDLHMMIATAELMAYKASIPHKEYWRKVEYYFRSRFGLDINKFSIDSLSTCFDICDTYLNCSAFTHYFPLLKLCNAVFEIQAISNIGGMSGITSSNAYEYIIQQGFISGFRREILRRHKLKETRELYKDITCSITDKLRNIRQSFKNEPMLGGLVADAVLDIKYKNKLFYSVVLDVKTNLKLVDENGFLKSCCLRYKHNENMEQVYHYVGEKKNISGVNDVIGVLAHVCFNSLGWESVHKRDNQAGKHPEVNKVCCYVTNFNDDVFDRDAFSRSIADLYDYIGIDNEIRKFKSNLK